MSDKSGIEWTDATWNPVTGCSKISPGCAHCYAETLNLRFGWSRLPWTPENAVENVVLHPERLDQPLRWPRPRITSRPPTIGGCAEALRLRNGPYDIGVTRAQRLDGACRLVGQSQIPRRL